MDHLSACSDCSTSLPGSTCKMVFTLSRNTLARFSSPFAAPTLNTFVDSPVFEQAIVLSGGFPVFRVEAVVEDLPVNMSYTSGCLRGPALSAEGFIGTAIICGMYLPLEVFMLTLLSPSTSLNSSSAVGFEAAEHGRLSLASSVARAMKVERGRVTPKVAWMRFWTEITDDREMGMAISISFGSSSGAGALCA